MRAVKVGILTGYVCRSVNTGLMQGEDVELGV